MAAPEIYSLAQVPLSSHAFNADRSRIAVSLNTNEAQILSRQGNEFKLDDTLTEHDKLITSIDWAPNTNRIVTCSQDRNAYVWTETPNPVQGLPPIWKPTLVLLRINRAATAVRWSPLEDKFAVASGARAIAVCSFDADNNWWVSRLLKKPIRSTVLSVDWHPNNVLLAAGSADMKARVFSAYIKDVDKKPTATVWGEKLPFNTLCGEYSSPSGGWVHSVGFSPSGDVLAFVSHDSSVTLIYPGAPAMFVIKTTTLPYVTLTWINESSLITAGHDCQPILYSGSLEEGWAAVGSLDDTSLGSARPSSLAAGSPSKGAVGRLNNEAFNRFKSADTRGTASSPSTPLSPGGAGSAGGDVDLLPTVHQNTITSVRPYEYNSDGSVGRVSTGGVDGKLVIWSTSAVGGLGGLVGKMAAANLRR